MRLNRRQLRNLINEALGDKLKDAAGKVKSKIDQVKGGGQQATSSSSNSANKSLKDQAQDMVDEDPANRAMGEASLKQFYEDKGQAKKSATRKAESKLKIGAGAGEVLLSRNDGKVHYTVLAKK